MRREPTQLREKTTKLLKTIGLIAGVTVLAFGVKNKIQAFVAQLEQAEIQRQREEEKTLSEQKMLSDRIRLPGRKLFLAAQDGDELDDKQLKKWAHSRFGEREEIIYHSDSEQDDDKQLKKWAHSQFGEQKTAVYQDTHNTDDSGCSFVNLVASDKNKLN